MLATPGRGSGSQLRMRLTACGRLATAPILASPSRDSVLLCRVSLDTCLHQPSVHVTCTVKASPARSPCFTSKAASSVHLIIGNAERAAKCCPDHVQPRPSEGRSVLHDPHFSSLSQVCSPNVCMLLSFKVSQLLSCELLQGQLDLCRWSSQHQWQPEPGAKALLPHRERQLSGLQHE